MVRPLNVIVPEDVRVVRPVRLPAIVLLPTIVRPPAVLLMFAVVVSVPVTSKPFAETETRPVPVGTSWMPVFVPTAVIWTGRLAAEPSSLIWFTEPPPNDPKPDAVTSPVAAVTVSFGVPATPTVRSPTELKVPATLVLPLPAMTLNLFVLTLKLPVTSRVLRRVAAPVTPRVPATVVAPVAAVTLNLFVFTAKLPVTPSVPSTDVGAVAEPMFTALAVVPPM